MRVVRAPRQPWAEAGRGGLCNPAGPASSSLSERYVRPAGRADTGRRAPARADIGCFDIAECCRVFLYGLFPTRTRAVIAASLWLRSSRRGAGENKLCLRCPDWVFKESTYSRARLLTSFRSTLGAVEIRGGSPPHRSCGTQLVNIRLLDVVFGRARRCVLRGPPTTRSEQQSLSSNFC